MLAIASPSPKSQRSGACESSKPTSCSKVGMTSLVRAAASLAKDQLELARLQVIDIGCATVRCLAIPVGSMALHSGICGLCARPLA